MDALVKSRKSHIFAHQPHGHYVEPQWVSERLFEEEEFEGPILDPGCGWGRILTAAVINGYKTMGSDVVKRRPCDCGEFRHLNFVSMQDSNAPSLWWSLAGAIVCNPPFHLMKEFCLKACSLMQDRKNEWGSKITRVAMIVPVRRLPAAIWLEEDLPLYKVLLLTPRPSMPSADHIKAGGYVGGGTQDFAWLLFKRNHLRRPTMSWLHRDGTKVR